MKLLQRTIFSLALVIAGTLLLPAAHASVAPATATTTLNITVSESVTVSATPNTLSATYTGGNVVFSGITVNSSWNTAGTEDSVIVYASVNANALVNGASNIPAANLSAAVTGSAAQGLDYCNGAPWPVGGSFSGSVNESCSGGPGLNVSNAVIVFASNDNKNVAGAPNTQAAAFPNGSASNTVVITTTPIASMQPGTYSGVLTFTIFCA